MSGARAVKIGCRSGLVLIDVEGAEPMWVAPEEAARLHETLGRAIASATGGAALHLAERVLATRKGYALALAQLVGSEKLSDVDVSKVVQVGAPGYIAAMPDQMAGREASFLDAADRAFEQVNRAAVDGGKLLELVAAGPPKGDA